MAKRKSKGPKQHAFRNKLVLNQWLVSLFGIDPLTEQKVNGKVVRPFHKLAEPIRDPRLEGLDKDNLHFFYHHLGDSPLFSYADPTADFPGFRISRDMLLTYEQNIVRHYGERYKMVSGDSKPVQPVSCLSIHSPFYHCRPSEIRKSIRFLSSDQSGRSFVGKMSTYAASSAFRRVSVSALA
jgi:hypothetical protein